ncbi:hypothetical protein OXPF_11730 [Oxobacter pfennigii]|uniref:Uncharacterized protein n=1 Tax=Oxobacter pfennigii TaxID=36849 RepID=A0A0N8NTM9_9CLOT|nr:hypothetical protein [Oxobacter pfennigii]KPU45280.1 hypothetical protein OXPF_11730 [Oxobacter pfennigii]
MNKNNIIYRIFYLSIIILFLFGSAYIQNVYRIRTSSGQSSSSGFYMELIISAVFGMLLGCGRLLKHINGKSKLSFKFENFIFYSIPCIVFLIIELNINNGSFFFHKTSCYFASIMLGYGIASSLKKKDIKHCGEV